MFIVLSVLSLGIGRAADRSTIVPADGAGLF